MRSRPDSVRGKDDSVFAKLFGPGSDLGLRFTGQFQFKNERTRNDRCIASLATLNAQCNSPWQQIPEFQFTLKTGGTFAERFKTQVDYDSRREYDGSNNIGLSYLG